MLQNLTRRTLLTKKLSSLKSWRQKTIGLLGNTERAVTFKTRFGIHTFGLKFPIDIIVTDKNLKIISLKENLKPNRIFLWNPRFDTIFELPKNTIKKSKTRLNDKLIVKL